MFCNKCGAEIANDSMFCNKCGCEIISNSDNLNEKNVNHSINFEINSQEFEEVNSDYTAHIGKSTDNYSFGNNTVLNSTVKENFASKKNSKSKPKKDVVASIIGFILISAVVGLFLGVIIFLFVRRDFVTCFAFPFWATLIMLSIAAICGTYEEKKKKKLAAMTFEEKERYNLKQKKKAEDYERYKATQAAKQPSTKQQYKANKKAGIVSCPKCGSQTITTSNKKISVGKGVAGAAVGSIINPVGTVVGAAVGATHSKKVYNVCMNCGHRWKP